MYMIMVNKKPRVEIPTLDCLKCGHMWIPRVVDPKICPKCGSPRWDEP